MSHDDEIDKELRFHVDTRIDELIASGVAAGEARRQARLEFGGVTQTKEAVRDQHLWSFVDGLLQDLRLAFRTLRATPVVTLVAVLSLALGIGANTAIFSLVNSLLLRALPVRDPAQLVLIKPRIDVSRPEWTFPTWLQIQERRALFDGVTAYSPTARANLTVPGDTQHVDGLMASGSFFETLGVSAIIGRTFSDADDRREGGPDGPVAVISYGFWQRYFHGAGDVIGKILPMENVPFTVIGVTPADFFGPDVGRTFDAIVPLGTEPLVSRRESRLDNPSATWLNVIARVRADRTLETTRAALRANQAHIFDVTRPPWGGEALEKYLKQTFEFVPAATGGSTLRETYQRPLVTILGVVALVLLIACANIANLLLARTTARRHELSVRRALGASRWRLARQLLTESVLLATIGSTLGLLIALWGSRVALLSAFFGGLALLLAGLGLYGVTSYAVSRRRKEIGIRMALGADAGGVVRLVLMRVIALVACGVITGAGLSLWTSKFVATLLYGLEPRDPATLAGAAAVLAAVGLVAGWLPAHRASRIDPAEVLRDA